MQNPIRLYTRYSTDLIDLTYVSHNHAPIGRIHVLSYGGMLVKPTADSLRLAVKTREAIPKNVEVTLFGKTMKASAEVRSLTGHQIGYRFTHQESELLSFLKSVLDPIKWGQNYNLVEKVPTPTRVQWLGTDEHGILNFSFLYWNGKLGYQLSKKGKTLTTYHNVAPGAILSDLKQTDSVDENILRTALAFALGLTCGNLLSPYTKLLEFLLNEFKQSTANPASI